MPKHHKTIVGLNPSTFEELREAIAAALPAFRIDGEDFAPDITQFLVDDKRQLAVVTFKTHGDRPFEAVAELIRQAGCVAYEIGPINLDDRLNV